MRDNLRFAWRNLAKHKMYTLVNLLGLTLGLTAFSEDPFLMPGKNRSVCYRNQLYPRLIKN